MSLITPSLHMDLKNPEITALVCKALSSEVRLKILDLLTDYPKNISDLADILDIPMSTMTTHIRLLDRHHRTARFPRHPEKMFPDDQSY